MSAAAWPAWAEALGFVAGELERRGEQGWLVGGCLRDALLGVPVRDLDLAVTGEPLALARVVHRHFRVPLAELKRGTVRVVLDATSAMYLDITPLNGPTIEFDLNQRDFRVNALALPLGAWREFAVLAALASTAPPPPPGAVLPVPDNLVDPLGGLADLCARVLRTTGPDALAADPGRILRAARLAAARELAVDVHPGRARLLALLLLPGDRVREEMNALLALPRAADGVRTLAEMEALATLFPPLESPTAQADVLAALTASAALQEGGEPQPGMEPLATLDAVRAWYAAPLPDGFPRMVALRWGLLLYAAADANERPSPIPLAAPTRAIVAAIGVRVEWMRAVLAAGRPVEHEMRRFFAQSGDRAVDVVTAAAAIEVGKRGARAAAVAERARTLLETFFTDRERLVPPALLTGADLIHTLGMSPGPAVGRVLAAVRAAQLDGTVTTAAEALALARGLAGER